MTWDIAWSRRAEKDLLVLAPKTARRIFVKVGESAEDPPATWQRLQGADEWKLRVGEHRVLAYLSFADRRLTVARVSHRSTAYR